MKLLKKSLPNFSILFSKAYVLEEKNFVHLFFAHRLPAAP